MKKSNSVRKFANRLIVASLVILTSFSVAEAQHHSGGGSRGFSGGGRSFDGSSRISSASRAGIGFGGGYRIAAGPRFAPGRYYGGGFRGGINVRPGYSYRGSYGRPYYGGVYRRPFFGNYGTYYRGYYPHIGFYLNVLPFGYYPFSYGGYPYYYNQGLFYQQYNDGYQVVEPPVGAEVPRLPRGSKDITIDGQQYFEKDGVYYLPVVNQDGKKVYQVAGKDGVLNTDGSQQDNQQPQPQQQQQYNNNSNSNSNQPQVGDVVNSIPPDSRAVRINGEKLYVSPDGVYYQEDNSGNTRIFKVVGVPSDDADTVSNP